MEDREQPVTSMTHDDFNMTAYPVADSSKGTDLKSVPGHDKPRAATLLPYVSHRLG